MEVKLYDADYYNDLILSSYIVKFDLPASFEDDNKPLKLEETYLKKED